MKFERRARRVLGVVVALPTAVTALTLAVSQTPALACSYVTPYAGGLTNSVSECQSTAGVGESETVSQNWGTAGVAGNSIGMGNEDFTGVTSVGTTQYDPTSVTQQVSVDGIGESQTVYASESSVGTNGNSLGIPVNYGAGLPNPGCNVVNPYLGVTSNSVYICENPAQLVGVQQSAGQSGASVGTSGSNGGIGDQALVYPYGVGSPTTSYVSASAAGVGTAQTDGVGSSGASTSGNTAGQQINESVPVSQGCNYVSPYVGVSSNSAYVCENPDQLVGVSQSASQSGAVVGTNGSSAGVGDQAAVEPYGTGDPTSTFTSASVAGVGSAQTTSAGSSCAATYGATAGQPVSTSACPVPMAEGAAASTVGAAQSATAAAESAALGVVAGAQSTVGQAVSNAGSTSSAEAGAAGDATFGSVPGCTQAPSTDSAGGTTMVFTCESTGPIAGTSTAVGSSQILYQGNCDGTTGNTLGQSVDETTGTGCPQGGANGTPQYFWGVDSGSAIGAIESNGQTNYVNTQQKLGQPIVWGRYLGGAGLRGTALTASEIGQGSTAANANLAIMPIYAPSTSELSGSSTTGVGDAKDAIAKAIQDGIETSASKPIVIMADIEKDETVTPGWISGWTDYLTSQGWLAGFYANTIATQTNNFDYSYCSATTSDPQMAGGEVIWSNEPEPKSGVSPASQAPSSFAPHKLDCPAPAKYWAWQYAESNGSLPNVDENEVLPQLMPHLFSAHN